MNIIANIFAVLISFSASAKGKVGADEYRFETKEYEHTSITVDIVLAENRAEFRRLAREHGLGKTNAVGAAKGLVPAAFSVLHPREKQCTIYILDPEYSYEPEYIGHELAHCIWGRFHNDL